MEQPKHDVFMPAYTLQELISMRTTPALGGLVARRQVVTFTHGDMMYKHNLQLRRDTVHLNEMITIAKSLVYWCHDGYLDTFMNSWWRWVDASKYGRMYDKSSRAEFILAMDLYRDEIRFELARMIIVVCYGGTWCYSRYIGVWKWKPRVGVCEHMDTIYEHVRKAAADEMRRYEHGRLCEYSKQTLMEFMRTCGSSCYNCTVAEYIKDRQSFRAESLVCAFIERIPVDACAECAIAQHVQRLCTVHAATMSMLLTPDCRT